MKTAIEWLEEQLKQGGVLGIQQFKDLISNAKEMEKQQIIDAYDNSDPRDSGEQYYNETFKTDKG